jgi:hypothetical protein
LEGGNEGVGESNKINVLVEPDLSLQENSYRLEITIVLKSRNLLLGRARDSIDKIHELCKLALSLPDSPEREDIIDRLKNALDEYSDFKREHAARRRQ